MSDRRGHDICPPCVHDHLKVADVPATKLCLARSWDATFWL
jgi:hypothetical protein